MWVRLNCSVWGINPDYHVIAAVASLASFQSGVSDLYMELNGISVVFVMYDDDYMIYYDTIRKNVLEK